MPFAVNLKDRGPQVIQYIDLFDEGQFGAGELALRGRYETLGDVKAAIEEVLAQSPIEDPKTDPPTSILSFHRFDAKNKWGKRLPLRPLDPYPFKARWMVHFLLGFRFNYDYCYVDLGVKWEPYYTIAGKLNPEYPLGKHSFGDTFTLADLSIVRVSCGTIDDAIELVKELNLAKPTDPNDGPADLPSGEVTDDQLQDLLEDMTGLVITKNHEDYYLYTGNDTLLVYEEP